jgi:LAO/AO transport system kinase
MALVDTIIEGLKQREPRAIARAISMVEDGADGADIIMASLDTSRIEASVVLGITGPPGAGKSTLTNELIQQYRARSERVGIIAIDPSSPVSGGALLGDRIRMMQHAVDPDVVVRSMASRGRLGGLCAPAGAVVRIMAASGCSPIIIETVGVGQSEMDIIRLADITVLVLAPGLGDDIQAMKAGLLEVADLLIVNKADCPGAEALAMDLEGAVRQNSTRQTPVCLTAANTGDGIDDVIATLETLAADYLQSGEIHQRRLQSRHQEILDWTMEYLRPRLLAMIKAAAGHEHRDPQTEAKKIMEKNFPAGGPGS